MVPFLIQLAVCPGQWPGLYEKLCLFRNTRFDVVEGVGEYRNDIFPDIAGHHQQHDIIADRKISVLCDLDPDIHNPRPQFMGVDNGLEFFMIHPDSQSAHFPTVPGCLADNPVMAEYDPHPAIFRVLLDLVHKRH